MKTIKRNLGTVALATTIIFTAISCKDVKKENEHKDMMHSEMNHSEMNHSKTSTVTHKMDSNTQNSGVQKVLADYITLKDALVETNKDKAAEAGKKLKSTLNQFNISSYTAEQQKELKNSIVTATEQAAHIGKSEINLQRKHFKTLSKNIIDIIVITGTKSTLYQQFCPMYNGGSAWLSMSKDIQNPYYGSKMLTCGKVQKEIN